MSASPREVIVDYGNPLPPLPPKRAFSRPPKTPSTVPFLDCASQCLWTSPPPPSLFLIFLLIFPSSLLFILLHLHRSYNTVLLTSDPSHLCPLICLVISLSLLPADPARTRLPPWPRRLRLTKTPFSIAYPTSMQHGRRTNARGMLYLAVQGPSSFSWERPTNRILSKSIVRCMYVS